MTVEPFFDLVIFDLDGTLIQSEDIWAPAVQEAIREVFEENGASLPIPSLENISTVIGIPGREALHPFVPPSHHHLLPEIGKRVGQYGPRALRQGQGQLFEGVVPALQSLKDQGVHLAIASNCRQNYIDEIFAQTPLRPLMDEAYCLDSQGIHHKSDMVFQALQSFQTRRAVMVGDRYLDLEAAHQNGIPFIGVSSGFGSASEWQEAEGTIGHHNQLVPLLEERGKKIRRIVESMALSKQDRWNLIGLSMSGISTLARELHYFIRAQDMDIQLQEMSFWERDFDLDENVLAVKSNFHELSKRFAGKGYGRVLPEKVDQFVQMQKERNKVLETICNQGFGGIMVENSNLLQPEIVS